MTGIVIDPQATGWRDDGSEGGIQRVQVAHGNLVPVPFRTNNCSLQPSGTATAVINAANIANFDGTSSGIYCSIPANASLGNGARIVFWFNGPVLGLRYSPYGGLSIPPMSVDIDGISYDVPATQNYDAITNAAYANGLAEIHQSMIADDLGDGPHFCEIFLQQQKTKHGVVYLHGYLAAESAGYSRPQQGIKCAPAQVTLTGSYAAISAGNSSLSAARKLFFYNPTGGAITVMVRASSSASNPFWVKSVAAGDTAELDLGGLSYDIASIQALGNGVICSLMGAQ